MIKVECKDPKKIKIIQHVLAALKKIGDDLKLEIDSNQFVMRSLNTSNSALPVVRFFRSFFNNYEYNCDSNQVLSQISIQYLLPAFKNVQNASTLNFFIDPIQLKFTLKLDDKSGISHSWELFMQDTVLLTALYDINSSIVNAKCRTDIFDGVKSAFRGSDNVYLEASQVNGKQMQLQLSTVTSDICVSSSLTIKKGDNCQIDFKEPETEKLKLKIALADFLIAVKLSSILSLRLDIFMISPGHPVIIKSEMGEQVAFEMALATGVDEWSEGQGTQMSPRAEQSYPEGTAPSVTPTERSQTSPWRGVPASVSTQQTPMTMSSQDQHGMRDSQLMAMGLFDASPDYPYRRKIVGQYAENSQPASSSTSDSDS